MAMIPLNDLLPDIKALLAGSPPDAFLTGWLRKAARQWCRDTWAYGVTMSGISLGAGESTHQIEVPEANQAEFLALDSVKRGANVLRDTQWSVSPAGLVTFAWAAGSASEALVLGAILLPLHTADSIPDFVLSSNQGREAVQAWALHMVMAQPKKPWSDPNTSAYYKDEFDRLCSAARINNRLMKNRADAPRVKIPPFV